MNVLSHKVQDAKHKLEQEKKEQERKEFLSSLSPEEREEFLKFEQERREEAWKLVQNFFTMCKSFQGPYSNRG